VWWAGQAGAHGGTSTRRPCCLIAHADCNVVCMSRRTFHRTSWHQPDDTGSMILHTMASKHRVIALHLCERIRGIQAIRQCGFAGVVMLCLLVLYIPRWAAVSHLTVSAYGIFVNNSCCLPTSGTENSIDATRPLSEMNMGKIYTWRCAVVQDCSLVSAMLRACCVHHALICV